MPDSPQDVHKKALGKRGERLAEKYLKAAGCKILRRNYRTPFGEAGLVYEGTGRKLPSWRSKRALPTLTARPAEGVVYGKRLRYEKIARFYWMETGKEPNARFDVVEVFADDCVRHCKNAF